MKWFLASAAALAAMGAGEAAERKRAYHPNYFLKLKSQSNTFDNRTPSVAEDRYSS